MFPIGRSLLLAAALVAFLASTVRADQFRIESMAFDGSGRLLAAGSSTTGEVRVWDLGTGSLLRRIPAPEFYQLAFLPRSWLLVSRRGGLESWDPATGSRVVLPVEGEDTLLRLFPLAGTSMAATVGVGDSVGRRPPDVYTRFWELGQGVQISKQLTHAGIRNGEEAPVLSFLDSGRRARVLGGTPDFLRTRLIEMDVASGEILHEVDLPPGRAYSLSRDGRMVSYGDPAKVVHVGKDWQLREQSLGASSAAGFMPDLRRLVTYGWAGKEPFRVWDLDTGRFREMRSGLRAAPYDYDAYVPPVGNLLALDGVGAMELWDTASGKRLWQVAGEWGRPVFSPDARRLAIPSGRRIVVVNASTGKALRKLSF